MLHTLPYRHCSIVPNTVVPAARSAAITAVAVLAALAAVPLKRTIPPPPTHLIRGYRGAHRITEHCEMHTGCDHYTAGPGPRAPPRPVVTAVGMSPDAAASPSVVQLITAYPSAYAMLSASLVQLVDAPGGCKICGALFML